MRGRVSRMRRVWLLILAFSAATYGCAGSPTPSASPGSVDNVQPSVPKRVVAAVLGPEPAQLGSPPGAGRFGPEGELLAAGLANTDERGALFAELADALPSLDNGRWKLFPDGRMETSWTIRAGAQWHDGVPVTTDDLLFAVQLGQDTEIPWFRHQGYALIDSVTAIDSRTIVVSWKSPYTDADAMFARPPGGVPLAFPLPRHVLESAYLKDKQTFHQSAYWSTEFVGAGPFKLAEWVLGEYILLKANNNYVFGRPKVDEIELRFIRDSQALASTILSGAAQVTVGANTPVTPSDAVALEAQWSHGKVLFALSGSVAMFPQFLDPQPSIVREVQFRRALMYATDRQQINESIVAGRAPLLDGYLHANEPAYQELDSYLVKYAYDPRRATQLIESLGYTRGADGIFATPSGEKLSVGLRPSTGGSQSDTLALIVQNQWKQIGVETNIEQVPVRPTAEYTATFPSFLLRNYNLQLSRLWAFHTRERLTAETRFTGQNIPRYSNVELDSLIDRMIVTIPLADRTRLMGEIIRHLSDQAVYFPVIYNARVALVSNNLKGFTPGVQPADVPRPHLWELS
jgi:peptide/nickel transport system substrate-binding protein